MATLCNMEPLISALLPSHISRLIFFNLSLSIWIGLFLTILISFIISAILAKLLDSILSKTLQLKKLKHVISTDNTQLTLSKPINLMFLGWFFLLGTSALHLPHSIITMFTVAAKILTFTGISWLGFQITDIIQASMKARAEKTASKFDDLLAPLFGRSLRIFILLFVIISVAEVFSLPLSSLLAGLGIGGIAIAMAAKDTIANIFGSLTILIDRPFHIGDWVVIGDTEGTVENLGFRSTRVRTFYNSLVTIPNSLLLTAKVDNMGSRHYRRIKETLSLTYQTSPEKIDAFCNEIKTLIQNHPQTRKDYYLVNFTRLGDSALEILLYCFLEVPDWQTELNAKQQLLLDIYKKAKQMEIEFAYPTQTLFVKKE